MIEGHGVQRPDLAKRLVAESPALAHALLARLAAVVGRFLQAQIRAGAHVVQIFESSAGALAPADFREFALPYLATAVRLARGGDAGAPVIAFAPGAGWALEEIAHETGAEVVGINCLRNPEHTLPLMSGVRAAVPGTPVACQPVAYRTPADVYFAPPVSSNQPLVPAV